MSKDLTKTQKEILLMLEDGYTVKQIAFRRKTSIQAVYNIIEKIKKKGKFKGGLMGGLMIGGHVAQKSLKKSQWRLHGLRFTIKPYHIYPRYHRIRKERGNFGIIHRDWKVNLHKETIEIYTARTADFLHHNKHIAKKMMTESLSRTLHEISNRYGFEYIKEGYVSIKMVSQSYAVNTSDIAKNHKEYLHMKNENGKIWFIIDKSKGWEHEYVNSDTAYEDSEKVEKYFNDFRLNEPLSNTQLMNLISNLIKENRETAAGLNALVRLLVGNTDLKNDKDVINNGQRPKYIG